MGLREVVRPAGPLPASVYWLRRAAVLLVAAGLVAVVVVAIALAGGGGRPAAGPTAPATSPARTPPTSPTAVSTAPTTAQSSVSPTASATPPPCAAGALAVTVATSARTYPADVTPRFTVTLHTTGAACTATGGLGLVVTSGSDRVWGSDDCTPATDTVTSLAAAGSQTATRSWDRVRSAPGCATVAGDRHATAGTYRVTATWGGVTSGPTVFTLH